MKLIIGVFLTGILLTSCKNEEDKFAEWTTKAGRYDAAGALEVENKRAIQMEQDLSRRHRFYQALQGTYDGVIQTQDGNYNIRLILVPSLPPYPPDPNRIRTVSEVEQDLTNLYFNVQVLQWNPENALSAVGCRVKEVRPDMVSGEVFISSDSEKCSNFYALRLSGPSVQEESPLERAQNMAQAIINGNITTVFELHVAVQPTTNAVKYESQVARVQ